MDLHSHSAQKHTMDCFIAARKRSFNKSWRDFQPEQSRLGAFFHRLFLRFSIHWLRFEVALYSKSENFRYLSYVKQELAEFESQLHRLSVRHYL